MTDKQNVVAREVAEQEFERFAEAMDLDLDISRMDADDIKNLDGAKHTLVRAIERGDLVIDEKGQPVFTPTTKLDGISTLTFYEPTGASFMSMDGKKKGQDFAKMFTLMAEMTRQPEKTFSKLPQRDLKVCRTIVTLFLG